MKHLIINKNVKVLNEMPKGWEVLNNSTTAPVGYIWIYNGKSLFSKQRERAF